MKLLQINQPQFHEMLVEASPFQPPKGSLTASTQMPEQPVTNIPVHHTLCHTRIAKGKVVGPSPQLTVNPDYQGGHRDMILPLIEHHPKSFPLRPQCLSRRRYIQLTLI
jgi:hypothetical protein